MPPQMLAQTGHMRTDNRAKNTELGGVAASSTTAGLTITMEGNEHALAKYCLRMLDVPGRKLLNKDRISECTASLKIADCRLQILAFAYNPGRAARSTDCRF